MSIDVYGVGFYGFKPTDQDKASDLYDKIADEGVDGKWAGPEELKPVCLVRLEGLSGYQYWVAIESTCCFLNVMRNEKVVVLGDASDPEWAEQLRAFCQAHGFSDADVESAAFCLGSYFPC